MALAMQLDPCAIPVVSYGVPCQIKLPAVLTLLWHKLIANCKSTTQSFLQNKIKKIK
jgi:hypothetical protein